MLLGAVLALGAAALVLAWVGQQRAVRASHPTLEGRLVMEGEAGPAASLEIVRDRRGVPHVRAEDAADAWWGLGFAHAQDRLGQMLWLRRVAEGRTAERIGEDGLATDRWMRTLDLPGAARRAAEQLRGRPARALRAYAAGVRARLLRLREGRAAPPLTAADEDLRRPWTVADSLTLVKLYALGLEDTSAESLVLADVLRRLGPLEARRFFPERVGFEAVRPDLSTTARRGATRWERSGASPGDGTPTAPRPAAPGARQAPAPPSNPSLALRRGLGLAGPDVGSTAWVVGGAWTGRRGALLAADAHFAPRMPAPLYEAHVRGGALDVAGATLPGAPLFWIGFTPDVVWAATASRAVVMDLVVETLHPTDAGRYRDADGWRRLEVREERLGVAGGASETLTVRRTRRGPLVDALLPGVGRPLSLKWPGALPGDGLAGFLALPHAEDAAGVRRALARHHEPVVAVLYADRRGEGGLQMAGYVPRRRLPSGLVPVPGRNPAYDWREPIPFARLPARRLGPRVPYLVAADGPLDPEGRASIEYLWRSGERSRRIARALEAARAEGPLALADLIALQRDARSAGDELVARALRAAGPPESLGREARQVAALLRAWDGSAEADSRGAAAYAVFERRLTRAVLEPVLGPELLRRWAALPRVKTLPVLLAELRRSARAPEAAEALRGAVRQSLRDAWITLTARLGPNREKWTWGRLHPLRFPPLQPRGARAGRPLGPFGYGGDGTSVRVGDYPPFDDFETTVISTYRFVAAADDLDQALTALAPGQAEHPGHVHADDRLGRWLEGRPSLLSTSDAVIEDGPVRRLTLVPAD